MCLSGRRRTTDFGRHIHHRLCRNLQEDVQDCIGEQRVRVDHLQVRRFDLRRKRAVEQGRRHAPCWTSASGSVCDAVRLCRGELLVRPSRECCRTHRTSAAGTAGCCVFFEGRAEPLIRKHSALHHHTCTCDGAGKLVDFVHGCTIADLSQLPTRHKGGDCINYAFCVATSQTLCFYGKAIVEAVADLLALAAGEQSSQAGASTSASQAVTPTASSVSALAVCITAALKATSTVKPPPQNIAYGDCGIDDVPLAAFRDIARAFWSTFLPTETTTG